MDDNIIELKNYGNDNYTDIYSISNNIVDIESTNIISGELKMFIILLYAVFY